MDLPDYKTKLVMIFKKQYMLKQLALSTYCK